MSEFSRPSIYSFDTFSEYFSELISTLKLENSKISYGFLARKMGINSRSLLAMVASGQRAPSDDTLNKILIYLNFTREEVVFARLLVQIEAVQDIDDRKHLFRQLEKLRPKIAPIQVPASQWEKLNDWLHPAITELTCHKNFKPDPEWIMDQLQFEVQKDDIEAALKALQEVGLLEKAALGKLSKSNQNIQMPSEIPSRIGKKIHHKFLSLASVALETQAVENRHFSGITVALNVSQYQKIKDLIIEFERVFDQTTQASQNADAVYHLEVAFFQLTKDPE